MKTDLLWSVFMNVKSTRLNNLGLVPLNNDIEPYSYLEMLLPDLKVHPNKRFLLKHLIQMLYYG